jgi:hypothetical protein
MIIDRWLLRSFAWHGNRRMTKLDSDFLAGGDFEQIHKTGELCRLMGARASVRVQSTVGL